MIYELVRVMEYTKLMYTEDQILLKAYVKKMKYPTSFDEDLRHGPEKLSHLISLTIWIPELKEKQEESLLVHINQMVRTTF